MAEPGSSVIHTPADKKQFSDQDAQKKILTNFLYKAILFAIFVALLPLLSPQVPDSTNPTILSRTWELLHLLLVGIAVSYGLFSQRNADPEVDKDKEAAFKADTPQSYVSRILQISSVFDENTTTDESKLETWSSQYHGTEPIVVESKPLVLPVRSLRESRLQNPDSLGSSSVVLPSPIPWRSRSGRMEVGDEGTVMEASSPTQALYAKDGSLSSEMRGKTSEDSIFKKSFHRATMPPPPPPPPPPFSHGLSSVVKRDFSKNFRDELKVSSVKGREGFLKNSSPDAEPLKAELSSSLRSFGTVRSNEALSVEKSPPLLQQKCQIETKNKKKVEFVEKVVLDDSESEQESDSYDDEEAADSSIEAREKENENEVDKKADEFIAKFREQIRLQRIESIKSSSRHRAEKYSSRKR